MKFVVAIAGLHVLFLGFPVMVDFLFYLFMALTLGSAAMVVLSKNPVNAAMFLIVSMIGVASLFMLLSAFFLAVLQVLVYAGAVVVLFLFVVMLLDEGERRHIAAGRISSAASIVALVLLLVGAFSIVLSPDLVVPGMAEPRTLATTDPVGDVPQEYGYHLFTSFMLPFQVAGFLLLIAMIGVILLTRRFRDGSEVPMHASGTAGTS